MIKEPSGTRLYRVQELPDLLCKQGQGSHAERIHAHVEHSIGFVRHGSTRVKIGTRWTTLRAGQGIYVPAGVPHLCSPVDPRTFAYSVVYIKVSMFDQYIRSGIPACGMAFAGSAPEFPDFVSTIVRSEQDPALIRRRLRILLEGMLTRSMDVCGPHDSILEKRAWSPEYRSASWSRYQEYRWRKRRFGIGAHGCVQNIRIERAKQLLLSGSSMADTAIHCGFADQSHFIRTFRLYTGLRPSDYLRAS